MALNLGTNGTTGAAEVANGALVGISVDTTGVASAVRPFVVPDGTVVSNAVNLGQLNLKQDLIGKDATGGYAGLTLFKINFKNALNTITSFFTNANTVARTYTFQDRDGTIADNTDLATKVTLAGTAGGQTINGGTAAGETLTLTGTSSATKSATGIKLGSVVTVDEVNGRVGVGTTAPSDTLTVAVGGARFAGVFDEVTANAGVYAGVIAGTPRMNFANGTPAQNWEIDNNSGDFRWFLPGVVHMQLAVGALYLYNKVISVTGTGNNYFAGNVGIGTTTPTVSLDVVGLIKTSGYTVATLPVGVTGARAYVTDATAPTYNGALTGGGTVVVPVFYNGVAWVSA